MTAIPPLRLYLVRHGVTVWNRARRMQGQTNIPLDEEGVLQARQVAARLASAASPLTAVWSSDLSRARQTAEAIATRHRLEVRTSPLLREIMLGDWEGLTYEEIEARGDGALLARYRRDSSRNRPPGGESLDACADRMIRGLEGIRLTCSSGHVALVGHGGSLRSLLVHAVGAPVSSVRHLSLDNASLSIIEESGPPDERVSRLLLVNDTSHLASP